MPDGRKRYLPFDLGRESGRAGWAPLYPSVITTEEVHRFANEPVEYARRLHRRAAGLWFEIRQDALPPAASGAYKHLFHLIAAKPETSKLLSVASKQVDFDAQRTLTEYPRLPQDRANAITWLAGDASEKTTANIIPVDSGSAEAF